MSFLPHWGEINIHSDYKGNLMNDLNEAINAATITENEIEYNLHNQIDTENISLEAPDPLVVYSIELHKTYNEMQEKLRNKELNTLPIPEMPQIETKFTRKCFNFTPKRNMELKEKVQIELSDKIAKEVLKKTVALLTAQIGYTTTHESVLLVFADALEMFLKKICLKMVEASNDEQINALGGFPNFPERVLIELGFGGMKGLHDFYQTRVIKYNHRLYRRCKDILDEPFSDLPASDEDVKVMHISAGDTQVDYSTLANGYRLLSSFETLNDDCGLNKKKRTQ